MTLEHLEKHNLWNWQRFLLPEVHGWFPCLSFPADPAQKEQKFHTGGFLQHSIPNPFVLLAQELLRVTHKFIISSASNLGNEG